VARSVFDILKERGEEVMNQISGELMQNPAFIKAMQSAIKGKEKLEDAATQALRGMNIPTRTEFKKALSKIESLERELAVQKAAVEGLAVKATAAKPRAAAPRKRAAKAKPRASKAKTGA
jgi:DNA-binding NarL/FixJ family response regulator